MITASEGIDVSGHQRPDSIDWHRVASEGISWAYVKASEGTTSVDGSLTEHVRRAREAGVLVGAYHYFHPMTDSIRESADRFCKLLEYAHHDLPPCLDLETTCGGEGCKAHPVKATPQQIVDRALEWCERVEVTHGRACLLYSGPRFLGALGPAGDALRVLPLWCADYRPTPHPPAGYDVVAWQWTDGGATGPKYLTAGLQLDRNRSRLTALELAALGRPAAYTPPITLGEIAMSDPYAETGGMRPERPREE